MRPYNYNNRKKEAAIQISHTFIWKWGNYNVSALPSFSPLSVSSVICYIWDITREPRHSYLSIYLVVYMLPDRPLSVKIPSSNYYTENFVSRWQLKHAIRTSNLVHIKFTCRDFSVYARFCPVSQTCCYLNILVFFLIGLVRWVFRLISMLL